MERSDGVENAAVTGRRIEEDRQAHEREISLRGLTKRFGETTVLDSVDLTLLPGEIHVLMGQNGSGKSTVIKVLSGVHSADAGVIRAAGDTLSNPVRPDELHDHNMAFVHQDLGLVDDLTVLENIRVGRYQPGRFSRRISWTREREHATRTLERLEVRIALDRSVGTLHASERAVVAIARALQGQHPGSGCIVFDESTQSLPRETLADFYEIIRSIARSGTSILVITHRLEEALALADRITVLRDGVVVAEGTPRADLTDVSLSHLILGRKLETSGVSNDTGTAFDTGAKVLELAGLTGRQLDGFSLDVHAGEVVGITGGSDSGLDEFPELVEARSATGSGRVSIKGQAFSLPGQHAENMQDAGLVVIPQHRLQDGLAGDLTAVENLTLPRVRRAGPLLLRQRWQLREFSEAVKSFGITPDAPHAPVSSFSGGNQQKLLLAKWLMNSPEVIVVYEATQAVDVGARIDILRLLRNAAQQGKGVVLCSIEAQDLSLLCDRVIVLKDGRQATQLTGNITANSITQATYA